jgi:hypothetical protein
MNLINYIKNKDIPYSKIINLSIQTSTFLLVIAVSLTLNKWENEFTTVKSHIHTNRKITRQNSKAIEYIYNDISHYIN